MKFQKTDISGVCILTPKRHADQRGSFTRLFDLQAFEANGLPTTFAQTAISTNVSKLTLRGMHFQATPSAESKLVHCIRGRIYDVVIDVRKESPTFCQWFGIELDGAQMLYVPEGCAHGFLTLEPGSDVLYHISTFHDPKCERGVPWDDPAFGVEWPAEPAVISERDRSHPLWSSSISCDSVGATC